ncbi:MAG: O-antigen ligase family protein [Bacteroidota bacterium]
MNRKNYIHSLNGINYFLGFLSLLTLPFSINLNSKIILLWGLSSLLLFTIKRETYFKILPYMIPFVVLFIIMATRDAFDNSLFDLIKRSEKKASFILIPLISCFALPLNTKKALMIFSVIISLLSIYCIVMGSINAITISDTYEVKINYWYYSYGLFSAPSGVPTNYFSLYVATALIHTLGWRKKLTKIELVMSIILLVTLVLLMTRIITIFVIVFLLAYFLFGTNWGWKKKLFISLGIIVALFIAFNFHPVLKKRYGAIYESKESSFSGLKMKLTMWNAIYNELIKENIIFGLGEKAAKEKVIPLYEKNNLSTAAKHGYNSHNQYIDMQLKYGALGSITLIILLATLFWISLKMKEPFYITFLLMISCMFLTESVLFRQKGIILFTFISCLFIKDYVLINRTKA